MIPSPIWHANKRYWNHKDIKKILKFRDSIKNGMLAEFNINAWGDRGKKMKAHFESLSEEEQNIFKRYKKARLEL